MDSIILRVAAKFKEKMVSDEGNVIYTYSERQVANRNKKKAERLEKLSKSIHKLRSQVKKDLKSKDRATQLTALAVALIDHTFERVGNEGSADEGHFGVTGWRKSHVTFGKGKATIKYVGKSGVKQTKTVTDEAVLAALKDAHEGAEDDAIFTHAEGSTDAPKVNAYLKKFDITAKDIRGYHANREMREALKAGRSGKLPEDKKEREKVLKKEWKKALESTAKAVGHEPATLGNQYLVPGLEDAFMKDGTVPEKMKLAAELGRPEMVVARFLQGARKIDWAPVDTDLMSFDFPVDSTYMASATIVIPSEWDRNRHKSVPQGRVEIDDYLFQAMAEDDGLDDEVKKAVEKYIDRKITWVERTFSPRGLDRSFAVR